MDIEKDLSRKQLMSSIFFTIIASVIVLTIIIGFLDSSDVKLKKKEAVLKSKYGSTQVGLMREIFSEKNMSPEEYEKKIDQIADNAIHEARYKRELKELTESTYSNVIYDLYLASQKWGIKDDKKLARIQSRLQRIAEDEIELHMGRYMGVVGIKEIRKEGDSLYKERLDTIEDYLPDENKQLYSSMKKSLNSIFKMESD